MKSKILASALALMMALGALSSLAAIATTDPVPRDDINITVGNATTLIGTVEDDTSTPNAMQKKSIDAYMKLHGWASDSLTFTKASIGSIFEEQEEDEIVDLSKELKLRGWIEDGISTLFVARQNTKLDRMVSPSYELVFAIFIDTKNAMVDAAVIKAYPYGYYTPGAKLYAFDEKIMNINADMTTYMNNKMYKPEQELESVIPGYLAPSTLSKNFKSFYKSKGWDLSKNKVYSNIIDVGLDLSPKYNQVLSDADVTKAMIAAADGGPQVMMLMPSSGFTFAEKIYKYKQDNSTLRVFVTFCAFGVPSDTSMPGATFSWIMVRTELNGKMTGDNEFFPLSASLKSILSDAKSVAIIR